MRPPTPLTVLVNRTNVAVMRLNATISPNARYAKVFPHMTDDGNFPEEFSAAKTVGMMRNLDNSQLDRIMQAYRLEPIETLSSSWKLDISGQDRPTMSRDTPIGDARSRQAKLRAIWEFLGCYQLINQERQ